MTRINPGIPGMKLESSFVPMRVHRNRVQGRLGLGLAHLFHVFHCGAFHQLLYGTSDVPLGPLN